MNNIERAILVAEKAHANQSYDIYPYIFHLKQVAEIAENLHYCEEILVACILHDILEDTDLSYNDIKKAFGEEVAEIVYCVTDEVGRNRKERKEKTYPKIKSNEKAVIVKICDRIANMKHSAKYNPSMLKTYQKEFSDFYDGIHSHSHSLDVEDLWEILKRL